MTDFSQKKALVIGGSRGIGQAIADQFQALGLPTTTTARAQLDTGDVAAMKKFAQNFGEIDVLVLNTGDPPKKTFSETTLEDWEKYHKQMFLGFVALLQNVKLAPGAYVFAMTSAVVKEPKPDLVLSHTYRVALTSLLKTLSQTWAERQVSIVCIAPNQIATERLSELALDLSKTAAANPLKRLGRPEEIGKFIRAIVENDIKYLNGVTINFDGGINRSLF